MKIAWAPQQGPQKALIDCPISEIFYGGARGGGKTDGLLGKVGVREERYGQAYNGIFARLELPMLDDAIVRSQDIFGPAGGVYTDHNKTWRLPNGGRLRFRPLERTSDADKYQGQNVTDFLCDEAGLYPDPKPLQRMHGVLRSAQGVKPQMILSGNPGGAGQLWIKQRYIDPYPLGMRVHTEELTYGGQTFENKYVFIPSKLQNNKILLQHDPGYIARLHLVGSDELVKAWLEGDWSAIEGAFFSDWSLDLIIEPFSIPAHWQRAVAFDWGSAKPFSVGWYAVVGEDFKLSDGSYLSEGTLVRYREWYGCKRDHLNQSIPNTGLKLTAELVGQGILERSPDRDQIKDWLADPSIFIQNGGPSIAERMQLPWRGADNRRVGVNGAMGGWDMMRQRMRSRTLVVFATCRDFIRTVPVLQHDATRAEDLDTDGEDHAADECRYMCMSRPFTRHEPAPVQSIFAKPTLQQMLDMHDRKRYGRYRDERRRMR